MNYLPSQRFFIAFLIALTLIGGSVWYSENNKAPKSEPAEKDKKTLTANTSAATNTDYDKDGLKDWEEALWKTDPKSPDTDGDGALDGKEVAEKRNPAVRGPNDALSADSGAASSLGAGDGNASQNLTEDFTETLAKALAPSILGRTSGSFSPKDLAGIAKSLPSKESILASAGAVTAADLAISEKNDALHVKEYFAAVFAVYEKYLLKFKTGEDLEILQKALGGETLSELARLDPAIAALEQSFQEIKGMPVPRGYEDFAVRELNYLLKSRRLAEIIRGADQDPLLAMAVLEPRIDLTREIRNFHRDMGKFLAEKNIAYAGERWGVMFQ